MGKDIKNIVGLVIFTKIITFLLMGISFSLLPFGTKYYYPNFVYPLHSPVTFLTVYKTWDAQHYLYVSENGYSPGNLSNAFPPLFPFLIHIVTFLTKSSFISGIVLANIFSIVGIYLFYRIVARMKNKTVAYRSTIALLIFPTSFFFSLIYTASLFFLLIMFIFSLIQSRRFILACLISFFLPLTRLIGVAFIIPLFFSYILEYKGHSLFDQIEKIRKSIITWEAIFVLIPIIGLVFSMVIMLFTTKNPFTQFIVQQSYVSHYSFFAIFNPTIFVQTFFTLPLVVHGYTNSFLDRLFLVGFICFLPLILKRVSFPFFIYALVFGILPVLGGSFMSYMRYLLVVFPIFITLGTISLEKRYQSYVFPSLFVTLLLQSLFIILHSLNYWVA